MCLQDREPATGECAMSDAPILGGVSQVSDIESAGDFEKKHTPYIELSAEGDKTRVTVKVGHWVSHPNTADHFIEWITILVGEAPIARFMFAAVAAYPDVSVLVDVDDGTTVRAIESCNLHGLWAAEATT